MGGLLGLIIYDETKLSNQPGLWHLYVRRFLNCPNQSKAIKNPNSLMNTKSSLFITLAVCGLIMGALSAQADITTGLVGWWTLGDGPTNSTAGDYSGHNNTGTLINFADQNYSNMWTTITDPVNMDAYAMQFNTNGHAGDPNLGTNTYVIVPDSSTLDQPSANKTWTLSAWVYPTVAPASEPPNAGIIVKGSPNNQAAYGIYMSGGNFVTVVRNAAGTGGTTANSSTNNPTLTANTWYNVTAVIQEPKPSGSSEILLYLNGVSSSGTNGNTYTTVWVTNAPVTIGCCMAANGLITNAFEGIIDQVRVYSRSLTASDVLQLYQTEANQLPPVITQQPVPGTVNQGAAFTNSVSAISSSTPSYQWYTNGVADAAATSTQFIINPATPFWNGVNYYVIVTNLYGAATSSVVQLTVETTIPTFGNLLPNTQTNLLGTNVFVLYAGANPAFSVSTLSATPVSYFWFTNGVPVGGALATNFSLTNVQTGSFNCYCVASNSAATVTSAVWSASVLADPLNSSSGLAPYPQQVLALNPIGYWRMNDTNVDGLDNNNGDNGYVCHDYVSGNDGVYTNVYLGNVNGGTGYNPVSDPSDNSAFFGDDADDENGDAGDQDANSIYGINFGSPVGTSKAFTVEAWVSGFSGEMTNAGIVTLGWGNGGEQFDIDCGAASAAYRFFFRDASGNTHGASSSVLPSANAGQGPWYHLVGVVDEINSHAATFYINGMPVGTAVVTNGSGVLASTNAMSIGARMGSQTSNFNDQFGGFINDVAVFNYALSSNQIANEYASAGGIPPFFITPPPTNETLLANGTLTIPAIAWGTGPLTNQWYDVNGNPIATAYGTTNGNSINAPLVYSNVPGSWNGKQVTLTVSNAYGSTNFAVTLTVLTAPVINTNIPSQITLLQGQSYTYVSGAIGAVPLDFQWYKNGTGIALQTNNTYSLTASSAGTFTYYVIVTNTLGAATSVVSTLTVLPPPTSSFATNILNLNPVGYWPMHEMEAPARGDIETNYGSLGLLGTGYYADWIGHQGMGIIYGFSGALANDPDTAVYFNYTGGQNTGATTNCLIIPNNSTNAVLNPPFSVECWFWPTNNNQDDIWAQSGFEGLNAGNEGSGNGSACGIRLYWGGNISIYTYDNSSTLNGAGPTASKYTIGQWHHLVLTCDATTNMILYVDGSAALTNNETGLYSPDYWDPITVMTGRGYTRTLPGGVDEFAVYNTNLQASDVQQHYTDGTGGSAGVYVSDVTSDHPAIYLRMDSSTYASPPASAWPVLVNYASSGANGVYTPGTMPGIAAGPVHANGLPVNGLTGTTVAPLSGVSSFADAGYAAAYNPVGSNAFTITAMFRGNPCDGRFEDIVGHSDLSWRIAMNSNGHLQCSLGQDPSNVVNSAGLYNDGNWHQVADVYQPASSASVTGTNLLYVDGVLDTKITGLSTNGIYPGTNLDVMIGAAPDYTNNPAEIGRQFDGQVCEVALFNAALTASQLQALYSAAGGAMPSASLQPLVINTAYGAGTFTSFNLTAGGTMPLTYQWYFNSGSSNYVGAVQLADNATNIINSSTTQLTLTNLATTDDGWYYAVVTNNYGSATSKIAILTLASPVNATPTNLVATITNNVLYLTWPTDHTGWQLQAQTNKVKVGIYTNWANYNPSTTTSQVAIPINLTNGTVFYRLIYTP
jgi:hypothetical protein